MQNGAHAGLHDSFQLLCHAIEAGGDMSPQVPEAVAQNEAMKELVAQGDPDPVRYILPARYCSHNPWERRKDKTTCFGVDLTRNLVVYRAAQSLFTCGSHSHAGNKCLAR